MKIAISRGDSIGNYPKYEQWLKNIDPSIECINLYGLTEDIALDKLKNCSGLLLSGGNDISPDLYNTIDEDNLCLDIDNERDELEIEVINKALEYKMPVLAICRGLQILNVALKGTLILDIEKEIGTDIKHKFDGIEKDFCYHNINIFDNSILKNIYNSNTASVNSYHHQAIAQISDELIITASTNDTIVETIEWKHPEGKSFLLGVQWHPERMNVEDKGSIKLAQTFIQNCKQFYTIN